MKYLKRAFGACPGFQFGDYSVTMYAADLIDGETGRLTEGAFC